MAEAIGLDERMRRRRALEEAEGRAVQCAAQCLLCLKKGDNGVELKTAQLKNLVAAAADCNDLRSLTAWIRYQMSRSDGWRHCGSKDGEMFGERLIGMYDGGNGLLRGALPEEYRGYADPTFRTLVAIFCGQVARLHSFVENEQIRNALGAQEVWSRIKSLAGNAKQGGGA